MSYFDEVYLKRMNRDGKNIQERSRTRKEKEFDNLFLKRTRYFATILSVDDKPQQISCSLQPSKWNQDKIVSNILVSLSTPQLELGSIVRIFQKIKEEEQNRIWLIYYIDKDITRGYRRYEAIELDSVINLTDEYGDTLETFPVKVVSSTSSFVSDNFYNTSGIKFREPYNHRTFISKDYDFLTKTTYFNYEDRGWEIEGKDNISIKGVAYVSIAEHLAKPPEPKTSKDILVGEDENFFLINR